MGNEWFILLICVGSFLFVTMIGSMVFYKIESEPLEPEEIRNIQHKILVIFSVLFFIYIVVFIYAMVVFGNAITNN